MTLLITLACPNVPGISGDESIDMSTIIGSCGRWLAHDNRLNGHGSLLALLNTLHPAVDIQTVA